MLLSEELRSIQLIHLLRSASWIQNQRLLAYSFCLVKNGNFSINKTGTFVII